MGQTSSCTGGTNLSLRASESPPGRANHDRSKSRYMYTGTGMYRGRGPGPPGLTMDDFLVAVSTGSTEQVAALLSICHTGGSVSVNGRGSVSFLTARNTHGLIRDTTTALGNAAALTPLMVASALDLPDMCALLLKLKADIAASTQDDQRTAVHIAVAMGMLNSLTALLPPLQSSNSSSNTNDSKNAMIVDAKDRFGNTALLLTTKRLVVHRDSADRNNIIKCMRMILLHNADVNTQDSNGVTPLMFTLEGSDEALSVFLLQHGASTETIDRYGRSAYMRLMSMPSATLQGPHGPHTVQSRLFAVDILVAAMIQRKEIALKAVPLNLCRGNRVARELVWHSRAAYVNLADGCSFEKEAESHITFYLFNEWVLREVCAFIAESRS